MIKNVTTNNFQQNYYKKNHVKNNEYYDITFGNKISIPKTAKLERFEKRQQKVEFLLRRIADKINVVFNHKIIDDRYNKLINVDEKSQKFMVSLFNYGKRMARGKEVEVNVENGSLMNIANSNDACIFIMNHDNQSQDPKLLGFFNSLLTREYILNGKAESCPRPKVILNEDILTSANPKSRAVLEKVGGIGVDANLFSTNLSKNGRKLFPVVKDFIENKVHLYIFPEGKMSAFRDLEIEYKFQTGVADIISQIVRKKEQVKVVPLGFAYKGKLGSIHIGEPIYFRKDGQQMLASGGNVNSPFASTDNVNFFKSAKDSDSFKVITEHNQPVDGENLPDYIAGVLCENLKICKAEAKNSISQTLPKEEVPIYNIDL